MPTQMPEVQWVILYFVYGQVFFLMGLVTGLQWRRRSRLELARSLPWLAAFGLTHGLTEWGYIFVPMQAQFMYDQPALGDFDLLHYIFLPLQGRFDLPPLVVVMMVIHLLLLAVSFFCLFRFGVELLLPLVAGSRRQRTLRAVPGIVLGVWAAVLVLLAVFGHDPINLLVALGDGWTRYFMAFPGAILAHLGLLRQARQVRGMGLPRIAIYLSGAAVGFSVYAVFGGLIVPSSPFLLARTINYDLITSTIRVPVPVFRSLCGLAIAIFVLRFLEVFEVETERLIASMQRTQVLVADRERIGRELHDGIIQNIYSAGLVLEGAGHLLDKDPAQVRERIRSVMSTLNHSIQDIRNYVFDLQGADSRHELQAVLTKLADDLRLDTLLEVDLHMTEHCRHQLSAQQTAHLSQIAREALRNIAEHANARHVSIDLSCSDEGARLTVMDDGEGIDLNTLAGNGHMGQGMANMQARARLMGGQCVIRSAPGQGMRIQVTAPFAGDSEKGG